MKWLPIFLLPAITSAAEPAPTVAPFDAELARRHQQNWASHLKTPLVETDAIGLSLTLLPPGEFQMGSSAAQIAFAVEWLDRIPRAAPGEADRIRNEEGPIHRVIISRPFRIGTTEVTIGQFGKFVQERGHMTETERSGGGNSSKSNESAPEKAAATWRAPGYPVTEDSPVSQITWNDMVAFCNWLSEKNKRSECYRFQAETKAWTRDMKANGYRLPTEAEWEYACRAGTTTHYSFGDDVADLDRHAWFNRTAEVPGRTGAAPVGAKAPNPFGLFDMHGNVWERCDDFWAPDWYARSPERDPQGPPTGSHRIVRGAGWHYFDLHARSAYRNHYTPISRTGNTGFRVVREL
jgi:sulfatase modifying factor 1